MIEVLRTDLVATGKGAVTAIKAETMERRDAAFILKESQKLLFVNS